MGHDGTVVQIAFAPDGERVATAGFDGTARLWDVATGKQLSRLAGHIRLARERVTRGLTDAKCRQYLHKPDCS